MSLVFIPLAANCLNDSLNQDKWLEQPMRTQINDWGKLLRHPQLAGSSFTFLLPDSCDQGEAGAKLSNRDSCLHTAVHCSALHWLKLLISCMISDRPTFDPKYLGSIIGKGYLPEGFCTEIFPSSSIIVPPPITELVQKLFRPCSNQRPVGLHDLNEASQAVAGLIGCG